VEEAPGALLVLCDTIGTPPLRPAEREACGRSDSGGWNPDEQPYYDEANGV